MNADILIVADAIVDIINSSMYTEIATRVYEIEYDLNTMEGPHIHVIPNGYSDEGPASRREFFYDAQCAVVVLERYIQTGRPTKEWIDERVSFVDECVFKPISNSHQPLILDEYWSQTVSVESVFNYEKLKQDKVFWSEILVTWRKVKQS